ncbi:hypothetical protein [Paenirhodobacter enshiensis]|uniref:hypothetical protein n=1 Tax=Paenirhodobacter enshiensis TaxID=1105367 RepID=UPI001B8018FC|nr:hypothetical protein [Paenirhodobacter enshiensis]
MENPLYFAAGNVLRPVETAGWSFREGRAVGRAIAADLMADDDVGPVSAPAVRVEFAAPLKAVVPGLMRPGVQGAPGRFQLRFESAVTGRLCLIADGRESGRGTAGSCPNAGFRCRSPRGSIPPP